MNLSKLSLDGIEDVTAALGEDNGENRIYRSARGRTVKVKVREVVPSPFGMRVFHISASDCGPDGKALALAEALRIAPVRALTHHAGPDSPPLAEWLEEHCRREVAYLDLCAENEFAEAGRAGRVSWRDPSAAT